MTQELDSLPLSEQVEHLISQDIRSGEGRHQIFEIKDAGTETAKTLVPQMGSDQSWLDRGEVDWRRFTNIPEIAVIWLSWFMNIPKEEGGNWSRNWCANYCNFRYSVGGENKKLVVAMQQAVSGFREKKEKRDTRTWFQRNITQRKQKPEPEYYDVG